MKKSAEKEIKGFVWHSLRISFYLMIALFLLSFVINFWILNLLFLILLVFNIVVSIIHLVKYKKKAFAIVALIISSLTLLFYIIGILTGPSV